MSVTENEYDVKSIAAETKEIARRASDLQKRLGKVMNPEDLLPDTLAELLTTVEELRVADEELRVQNEQLLVIQHTISQERQRYHDLFEFAPDAYLVTDDNGVILNANRAAATLFNVAQRFLVGKPMMLFIHSKDHLEFTHKLTSLSQTLQEWELRIKPRHNDPVYVILSLIGVHESDGKTFNARWMLRDISKRKIAEQEIQDLNTLLEEKVRERTAQLLAETGLKDEALHAAQKARIEAEALRDAALVLNSSLELSDVLDQMLDSVGRVVSYDAINIRLIEANDARVVRCRGYAEHDLAELETLLRNTPAPIDKFPFLNVLETGHDLIFSHPCLPRKLRSHPSAKRIRNTLMVPITGPTETMGFIVLHSMTPNFFGERHSALLQAFAAQTAVAIRNAQLYEQAQQMAIMEERQRLARDLHDAVSQTLFSASVIAEALPRLHERKPQKAFEHLKQLHSLVRGALAEMRTLLVELRPATLENTELHMLLKQLGDALQGRKKITVALETQGYKTLPYDIKAVFYRIAQEALNNVVKHSHATQVNIYLWMNDQDITMSISDNGKGIFPQSAGRGLGLETMRERAESIGAKFKIYSLVNIGTEVQIIWTPQK